MPASIPWGNVLLPAAAPLVDKVTKTYICWWDPWPSRLGLSFCCKTWPPFQVGCRSTCCVPKVPLILKEMCVCSRRYLHTNRLKRTHVHWSSPRYVVHFCGETVWADNIALKVYNWIQDVSSWESKQPITDESPDILRCFDRSVKHTFCKGPYACLHFQAREAIRVYSGWKPGHPLWTPTSEAIFSICCFL